MTIQSLGYLGIGTPDPATWRDFAREVIGLAVLPEPEDSARYHLRMDQHPFRFWVEEAPTSGVTVIGWEVRDSAAIDELGVRLKKAGVDVVTGTDEECKDREVAEMVHFTGPCDIRTELFSGRRLGGSQFISPLGVDFVTGEQGLGHVVMKTPHIQEAVDFYCDVLEFRLSDTADYPWGTFYFLGCNPRHHSVAFVRSYKTEGTHHILCEVSDPDDVGRALDRVRDYDVPLMATLGKHANDGMFSFYMNSPAGFGIEIGAGGVQVDERRWISRTYTADIWGHHPAS
ncbi:VOC family protein [Nocardia sp. NBC_00881]|uniref:VOC family protein n=1 Tax=Nocardia sp. NBC_00881 TaxID=2975995 RepID=UPI003867AA16|nr:VOC family protein [Nocardia sp. NBC_00881]